MSYRSYVDPCLFIVFIHIHEEQVDEDLEEALKVFRPEHGAAIGPILAKLPDRNHQILFHETYHYWQGLRLPYLYRYALLSYRLMMQAFFRLSLATEEFEDWQCELPQLIPLYAGSRVGFRPDGNVFWGGLDAEMPVLKENELTLRPMDLLECAASLAEFQATRPRGELYDPVALKRWRKRNPNYLIPFDFASRWLESDALAMRCLLPLINAAFHTTIPVRAFIELLARTWVMDRHSRVGKAFLAQPEPCRWGELYQMELDSIEFEAGTDASWELSSSAYFRLTLKTWVEAELVHPGEAGSIQHPFLATLASRWAAMAQENPGYTSILDMPWINPDILNDCWQNFAPPLTLVRFHLARNQDKVLLYGTGDISRMATFLPGEASQRRGLIADTLAMYGAVRRASGVHFEADLRTCFHDACPHYGPNYCNAYPVIPDHYEKCGFSDRMTGLIQLWRGRDGSRKTQ